MPPAPPVKKLPLPPPPPPSHQQQQQQSHPNEIPDGKTSSSSTNELWSSPATDTPKIISLDVKCEKKGMKVFLQFDKPFFGIVFSKGHYNNMNCVYLPAGLGRASATFEIGKKIENSNENDPILMCFHSFFRNPRLRYIGQSGKRPLRLLRRNKLWNIFWKYHCHSIRSTSARGLGSSTKTALHMARPVREECNVSSIPSRYAGYCASWFRWRQCWLLDANPSWQGPMGIWSVWFGENRSNDDNGVGNQGWWQQIRYVGTKLCCAWWKTSTNSIGRSTWLCDAAEAYVALHENQELRCKCFGIVLCTFPSLQIPRLNGSALPMHDTDLPLQLSRAVLRWQRWLGSGTAFISWPRITIRSTTATATTAVAIATAATIIIGPLFEWHCTKRPTHSANKSCWSRKRDWIESHHQSGVIRWFDIPNRCGRNKCHRWTRRTACRCHFWPRWSAHLYDHARIYNRPCSFTQHSVRIVHALGILIHTAAPVSIECERARNRIYADTTTGARNSNHKTSLYWKYITKKTLYGRLFNVKMLHFVTSNTQRMKRKEYLFFN